jgi:peptide/nickel transport system ATP-binding protein
MADALTLTGLTIRAGQTVLVEGVDLALAPGELVALVGQSGSGKSLTSRAMLGLVDIDPGVVAGELVLTVGDRTLRPYADGFSRRARERLFRPVRGGLVGYLPQDARAALDPLSRVGRQVATAARLSGGSPDPLPWLARANLPDPERVAGLWPHELSGGMAQRVVIAQALARGSRFLLADEPTSALDPTVQRSILDELRRLVDTGIAVLLVTHDLRVLPGLADRVVILHAGEVVERTTPDALRDGELSSEAGRRLVDATRLVAGGVLG